MSIDTSSLQPRTAVMLDRLAETFAQPRRDLHDVSLAAKVSGKLTRFLARNVRTRPLVMRKLIAFDDDTLNKLTQLGRDRMGTLQELADEAFADLLKKHGVPIDLKDALRKSASTARKSSARSKPARRRSDAERSV